MAFFRLAAPSATLSFFAAPCLGRRHRPEHKPSWCPQRSGLLPEAAIRRPPLQVSVRRSLARPNPCPAQKCFVRNLLPDSSWPPTTRIKCTATVAVAAQTERSRENHAEEVGKNCGLTTGWRHCECCTSPRSCLRPDQYLHLLGHSGKQPFAERFLRPGACFVLPSRKDCPRLEPALSAQVLLLLRHFADWEE